jgi:hypothetical protein
MPNKAKTRGARRHESDRSRLQCRAAVEAMAPMVPLTAAAWADGPRRGHRDIPRGVGATPLTVGCTGLRPLVVSAFLENCGREMLNLSISVDDPNRTLGRLTAGKQKGRDTPPSRQSIMVCSGRLPSPSPPREKTTARGHEAGPSSADGGAGNGSCGDVESSFVRP